MSNNLSLDPASYYVQRWKGDGFLSAKTVPNRRSPQLTNQQIAVFNKILKEDAAKTLLRPSHCETLGDALNKTAMDYCLYTFTLPEIGEMYACGCTHYDPKAANSGRLGFESHVVNKSLNLARQKQEIKIAILAPGFLCSDFFWLIRTIAQLKQISWQGTIRLNLIDSRYLHNCEQTHLTFEQLTYEKNTYIITGIFFSLLAVIAGTSSYFPNKNRSVKPIMLGCSGVLACVATACFYKFFSLNKNLEKFSKEFNLRDQLRTFQAIKTFLTGLAIFAPNTIQIKSNFFNSARTYVQQCERDKYRNDLLIGSDLAEAQSDIPLLSTTQTANGEIIVI